MEQMIHIILQLHNHCTYVIQHGPHVGRVNMMRGVKQGCPLGCTLAPLLWAIYSTYLAHLIGNATDYDWMLMILMCTGVSVLLVILSSCGNVFRLSFVSTRSTA